MSSCLKLNQVFKDHFWITIGILAWYMQTPHEIHWKEAKRMLHYACGIVQFKIHYSSGGNPLLVGLTDSDWVDDLDDQKSTKDYVFILGSRPVTWDY